MTTVLSDEQVRTVTLSGEVLIDGVPYAAPSSVCRHDQFGVETETHTLVEDGDDPKSRRVGVRVALKAMCLGCGQRMLFVPGSLRLSDDGSRTRAAVNIEPAEGW